MAAFITLFWSTLLWASYGLWNALHNHLFAFFWSSSVLWNSSDAGHSRSEVKRCLFFFIYTRHALQSFQCRIYLYRNVFFVFFSSCIAFYTSPNCFIWLSIQNSLQVKNVWLKCKFLFLLFSYFPIFGYVLYLLYLFFLTVIISH